MWAPVEDEIARKNYPAMPKVELMALLPLRAWSAIVKRGIELEVSRSDFRFCIVQKEGLIDSVPFECIDLLALSGRHVNKNQKDVLLHE